MEEETRIDARGLSSPQPSLLVRKAIRSTTQGTILVLVDSVNARDDVTRLAQKMGWQIMIKAGTNGSYMIELTK